MYASSFSVAQRFASRWLFTAKLAAPLAGRRQVTSVVDPLVDRWKEDWDGPLIKTAVPGPKTLEYIKDMHDATKNTFQMDIFGDYGASRGNYFVDVDGNRYLDTFSQVSSLPLGYNHPAIISAVSSQANLAEIVNRPALGRYPSRDYVSRVANTLLAVAPPGMKHVQTMMCGSCSVENAIKLAFLHHSRTKRGSILPPEQDIQSALWNQAPGSSQCTALSFLGSFHGRTLATSSLSRSKALQKTDIPALDWPCAPFPSLKYPLDVHRAANRAEEDRCLEEVRQILVDWSARERPVAACIIEPIQAEGGDNHATPYFFRNLQKILKEAGVAFIVDEVQTGGGTTGKMWAHEHWGLAEPVDIVCFSKKLLTGGIFYQTEYAPVLPAQIANTWMGDPIKLVMLEAVVRVILADDLLGLARDCGKTVMQGLTELQEKYPDLVSNVRGVGTFCAFDLPSADQAAELVKDAKSAGLLIGSCGERSIRLRPSLIFEPRHADIMFDIVDSVLANFDRQV